jgi:hypothetical protein
VVWDQQAHDWAFRASNHDWSEPIFACGGHGIGKGAAPLTDARKSEVTDGLTKAASMIGVGHEVFKGLVRADQGTARRSNGGNSQPDATAFWTLYRTEGQAVSLDVAKQLAGNGDWAAACQALHRPNTRAILTWAGTCRADKPRQPRRHPPVLCSSFVYYQKENVILSLRSLREASSKSEAGPSLRWGHVLHTRPSLVASL